jgi:small subunit ribosomal protein S6
MYILGSHIADPDVPALTEQVKKFVSDFGGTDIEESQLGKKKLAYPVKKTRNGYYVVVNFNMDAKKINELDARIRTQDQNQKSGRKWSERFKNSGVVNLTVFGLGLPA